MSSHCMYWGSGSAMSVDLRNMARAARAAAPKNFVGATVKETVMADDGKVTTIERPDTRAIQISGARRHAMAMTHGKT